MTDRVSAILLAGGKSRRMGVCKQTLVFAARLSSRLILTEFNGFLWMMPELSWI